MTTRTASGARPIEIGNQTIRKLRLRLLPFIFLLYVIALLDRINIGFAALTMNRELAISSQQYGLTFGIFFFGYFFFEIPSNLLLHKIGPRLWIARILITWGVVATASGFVDTAREFYLARFLLGLAEAGYFPGMVLYLTYWFPQHERARALALLLAATPVTTILGAPVSGLILDHVTWLGLSSWRWLLILEGMPAVVCGVVSYLVLPSNPGEAKFLTGEEKESIRAELGREEEHKLKERQYSVVQALVSARVWHLVLIYFGMSAGLYALQSWTPQLLKSLSHLYSNSRIGILVMIPSLVGLVAVLVVSYSSDRQLERRYHVAVPAMVAACALVLLGTTRSPFYSVILLACLAAGVYSSFGPFWTLPSEFLSGFSAAAGIALVNSAGNLGGFAGPYPIGKIAARTGNLYSGLAAVSVLLLLSAVLVVVLPKKTRLPSARVQPALPG